MRKRKVRTAFTCITLVLVTFALLSLTAVRRGSRFKRIAVGPAPYTGLLIPCTPAGSLPGTAALVERFGQNAFVSRVYWREGSNLRLAGYGGMGVSLGKPGASNTEKYPSFSFTNCVDFDLEEVNVTGIDDVLVAGRWFENDSKRVCVVPATLAAKLGVTAKMAEAQQTTAYVDGHPFTVIGIFDPDKLERTRDLDGQSMMPYDGSTAQKKQQGSESETIESQITLPEHILRLPGEQVVRLGNRRCAWVWAIPAKVEWSHGQERCIRNAQRPTPNIQLPMPNAGEDDGGSSIVLRPLSARCGPRCFLV